MSKNNIKLGVLIRIARKEKQLTQKQLARKARTKQPGITRAENKGCGLEFAENVLSVLGFEISNISIRAKDQFAGGLQFYS